METIQCSICLGRIGAPVLFSSAFGCKTISETGVPTDAAVSSSGRSDSGPANPRGRCAGKERNPDTNACMACTPPVDNPAAYKAMGIACGKAWLGCGPKSDANLTASMLPQCSSVAPVSLPLVASFMSGSISTAILPI